MTRQERTPMNTALKYLSRRDYSRSQLTAKLDRAGFNGSETAACLTRLEQWGYLNDREYGIRRILTLQTRLKSRAYVAGDLEAHGLPSPLVAELLNEHYPVEIELEIARRLLQKKSVSPHKSVALLARGGFAEDTIRQCFPDISPT